MSVPRYAGKHEHAAFLAPDVIREWRRSRGMLPERTPEHVVIVYQNELWDAVHAFEEVSPIGGRGIYSKVVTLDRTSGRVGVIGGFGIGAPVAAVILEELIALGVTAFVSMGTAGGLQPDLQPGAVVLCTGAVRDEGVSHHYTAADAPAEPDPVLTETFAQAIASAGLQVRRGSTWTIDAPYRETVAEARHYQAEGVLCVEMEAAALFTVAAHRNAAMASAFCISDSLADAEWNPLFDHPDLAHNLLTLFGAAVDVLER